MADCFFHDVWCFIDRADCLYTFRFGNGTVVEHGLYRRNWKKEVQSSARSTTTQQTHQSLNITLLNKNIYSLRLKIFFLSYYIFGVFFLIVGNMRRNQCVHSTIAK